MTMVFLRGDPAEHAPSSFGSDWTSPSVRRDRRDHEPYRFSPLALLREWRRRRRSRTLLSRLDSHMLKDIGITYAEAENEANKPFWLS